MIKSKMYMNILPKIKGKFLENLKFNDINVFNQYLDIHKITCTSLSKVKKKTL